jgi:acetyltransferase (GNAT) family protein
LFLQNGKTLRRFGVTTFRQSRSSAHGIVDQALSYRLESAEWLPSLHLVDQLARDKPEVQAERQMVAGGWMMYGGPQSPLNHMIGMGLQGPVSKVEFEQVEEFYRRHNSVCEVVVSPYSDASLLEHLGERGYRITEWNSVLVRELIPGEPADFAEDAIKIRSVGPDNARLWSEIVAQGFAEIAPVSPELFMPFASAPNSICFIAEIDGRTVAGAGGSVFPQEGIAPFYGAATLPEFRNRGAQNALFQARLQAAARAQCKLAVVCTLPGSVSQRNAERNGFWLAYTKVAMQRRL